MPIRSSSSQRRFNIASSRWQNYDRNVRAMQSRLFADPRPLVERLGRDFFLQLPHCPGVYLMRDRAARVLYVGKAKNLRKRVCSYRVANPERMAIRTLRLLRLVERIEWEICHDELTALRRESELLLSLKPRFNRGGKWIGPTRYLVWHCHAGQLEISVTENPPNGWHDLGPMGSQAKVLHAVLVRLVWFVTRPAVGVVGMPVGWAHGHFGQETSVSLGSVQEAVVDALVKLPACDTKTFCALVRAQLGIARDLFTRTAVQADLELLEDLLTPSRKLSLEMSVSTAPTTSGNA